MKKHRIIFCAYRDWAIRIADALVKDGHNVLLISDEKKLTLATVDSFKPEFFFAAGWSWYIPKEIFQKYTIIGLHPSPLPKYRGGSPLQNQIIASEKKSAVSLFKITENFDQGELYGQEEFLLDGHLDEIFSRISDIGLRLYRKIIAQYPNTKSWPQDNSQATYCKRRKPDQSGLTLQDFKEMSAEQLYNFIRALEDPYPNAFVTCADGKKIFIKRAELE